MFNVLYGGIINRFSCNQEFSTNYSLPLIKLQRKHISKTRDFYVQMDIFGTFPFTLLVDVDVHRRKVLVLIKVGSKTILFVYGLITTAQHYNGRCRYAQCECE